MNRRRILAIIAANLAAIVALVFAYPHLMVSPGALMSAHASLATDCFACHAPLRGPAPQRCAVCHAVSDIGVRTTKGAPIAARPGHAAFHQQLQQGDCMACHAEHQGASPLPGSRKPFSHAMLRSETRDACVACHRAPANDVHRLRELECAQCHDPAAWKPARFDHAALTPDRLARCETCHKSPADALHRPMTGGCSRCHAPRAWKPATFDHAKFFVLDGDHDAACATCHVGNDDGRYTCYGCHEHTPSNIRSKHEREGISNFSNCVACHRSSREGGEGGGERGGDD